MTNVSITRGCVQEPAEQFQEGADTYVRVCDRDSASLIVYSEEQCIVVVKADGAETLNTVIEANKSYAFPLTTLLRPRRGRSSMARAGFRALLGGSGKAAQEEPINDFLVEIRLTQPGAPLDGSYNFRMLPDESFDQRFCGYIQSRVVEEPKPIFTRDARPIECLANETKCLACGTVITDCIAGCENGDCPTVTATAQLKATSGFTAVDKSGKTVK
jgi:hypothetical protein